MHSIKNSVYLYNSNEINMHKYCILNQKDMQKQKSILMHALKKRK